MRMWFLVNMNLKKQTSLRILIQSNPIQAIKLFLFFSFFSCGWIIYVYLPQSLGLGLGLGLDIIILRTNVLTGRLDGFQESSVQNKTGKREDVEEDNGFQETTRRFQRNLPTEKCYCECETLCFPSCLYFYYLLCFLFLWFFKRTIREAQICSLWIIRVVCFKWTGLTHMHGSFFVDLGSIS